MLTLIYGKTVLMNLYVGKEWGGRYQEWTCGHSQGRRKWDEWRKCVLSHFSCVQLFVTLWTTACQAPLSMEFSRQE